MIFQGKNYILAQCEDIFKWFSTSKVGEYTAYYDKFIFHTENGCFAAYRDNLDNYFGV